MSHLFSPPTLGGQWSCAVHDFLWVLEPWALPRFDSLSMELCLDLMLLSFDMCHHATWTQGGQRSCAVHDCLWVLERWALPRFDSWSRELCLDLMLLSFDMCHHAT